jgi:hypothetical protein
LFEAALARIRQRYLLADAGYVVMLMAFHRPAWAGRSAPCA